MQGGEGACVKASPGSRRRSSGRVLAGRGPRAQPSPIEPFSQMGSGKREEKKRGEAQLKTVLKVCGWTSRKPPLI